jgi:hypothetical protein
MRPTDAAPTFPQTIRFPDVDAAVLDREDGTLHSTRGIMAAGGSWQEFLRKLLPPIPQSVELRA